MMMKALPHSCLVAVLVACTTGVIASTSETSQQAFQEAMYLELGQGDLSGAARLYEQLEAGTGPLNEVRARARWRLALCEQRLGHDSRAIALHESLLETITDSAAPELKRVRDAAAQSLLEIAEQTSQEGREEMAQDVYQRLRKLDPLVIEKHTQERDSIKRKLRILVGTWDQHPATNANVRIRLQPRPSQSPPSTAAVDQTTWHGTTDATGQLLMELPAGKYEIRASVPLCEREYGSATLISEREDPVELALTLERIKLPAIVHGVYLMGRWLENWNEAVPMTKVTNGIWELRMRLKAGRYEYKFRVNDQARWLPDVSAASFTPDGREGFNALLIVDKEQEITFRFDENDPHFQRSPHSSTAP